MLEDIKASLVLDYSSRFGKEQARVGRACQGLGELSHVLFIFSTLTFQALSPT